jgi:hypothetical protein
MSNREDELILRTLDLGVFMELNWSIGDNIADVTHSFDVGEPLQLGQPIIDYLKQKIVVPAGIGLSTVCLNACDLTYDPHKPVSDDNFFYVLMKVPVLDGISAWQLLELVVGYYEQLDPEEFGDFVYFEGFAVMHGGLTCVFGS